MQLGRVGVEPRRGTTIGGQSGQPFFRTGLTDWGWAFSGIRGPPRRSGPAGDGDLNLLRLAGLLRQRVPGGHRTVSLIRLACSSNGGVKFRPLLGLVLGLEEVADGAEAAGVAPCQKLDDELLDELRLSSPRTSLTKWKSISVPPAPVTAATSGL